MATVPTRHGPARVVRDRATSPWVTLVLGHGAGGGPGGGVGSRDLAALAAALPAHGVDVVRVEQPWRVAGRPVAANPAVLDASWLDVLAHLSPRQPLVVGGRSAGARVACRTAAECGAAGVLALAFPLHPPGRPDRSRLAELAGTGRPTLVVQGDRDTFGTPAELPAAGRRRPYPWPYAVVPVPGADHGFAVLRGTDPASAERRQQDALAVITRSVARWLAARFGNGDGARRG